MTERKPLLAVTYRQILNVQRKELTLAKKIDALVNEP
jgi:hypothetical protein